jgi:hypothetical protein
MHRKQQRTLHKIQKELKRELSHRDWLEQSLKDTTLPMLSRRRAFGLRTEKAEAQISKQN